MADALFDTTVFIDYYHEADERRGDESARSLVEAVPEGSLTACYSALTAFEIWIGLGRHEEEIDYLAVLDSLEEVPLNASMARGAATWLRALPPGQSEALFRDALIAATAAERAETLYTRNVRDFTRFYPDVRRY